VLARFGPPALRRPPRVLSDVLCEVGVTDAALGAGKATHVHSED
jgi:hypothetical protein